MTDNWDDEDDWDVDDDALDAKLGIKKDSGGDGPANNFDDEEDLALQEKAAQDRADNVELKKKGSALAAKKKAEEELKEKEEIARRILEEESAMMSKLSVDEQKEYQRKREMENDIGLLDDSYDGRNSSTAVAGQLAGDAVALKDMKDHLKHARKVAEAMKVSKLGRRRRIWNG
jgi:translation initiation factor 3 subunit J